MRLFGQNKASSFRVELLCLCLGFFAGQTTPVQKVIAEIKTDVNRTVELVELISSDQFAPEEKLIRFFGPPYG